MDTKHAKEDSVTSTVDGGVVDADHTDYIDEKDTLNWKVFYLYSEFWLISAAVIAPVAWFVLTFEDDSLWGTLRLQVIGFFATIIIIFLTGIAINRRHTLLENGITPWTAKLDGISRGRLGPLTIACFIVWAMFFRPIWTMPDSIHTLQLGYAVPALVPMLGVSAALIVSAMVVIEPSSRALKIMRTFTFLLGFGLFLYANFHIGYGGEDAATASLFDTMLIAVLPIMIAMWYIVDCFRAPNASGE